jgi:hypothetical protein
MLLFCSSTSAVAEKYALVVVVHRHRKRDLGVVLPDDVLVEYFFISGPESVRAACRPESFLVPVGHDVLVLEDAHAKIDAFVADIHSGPCDEALHLILRACRRRSTKHIFASSFKFRHGFYTCAYRL